MTERGMKSVSLNMEFGKESQKAKDRKHVRLSGLNLNLEDEQLSYLLST